MSKEFEFFYSFLTCIFNHCSYSCGLLAQVNPIFSWCVETLKTQYGNFWWVTFAFRKSCKLYFVPIEICIHDEISSLLGWGIFCKWFNFKIFWAYCFVVLIDVRDSCVGKTHLFRLNKIALFSMIRLYFQSISSCLLTKHYNNAFNIPTLNSSKPMEQ